MKWLYKISKNIHKYIGLVLILFLIWMSFSGIFLNHPELIGKISIPRSFVPKHYHIENWNRSSLADMTFSKEDTNTAYAAGKRGVWKTSDGGYTFSKFMSGDFPDPGYYMKTDDLFISEDDNALFASTYGGLFVNSGDEWRRVNGSEKEKFVKTLRVDSLTLAFSENAIYELKNVEGEYSLEKLKTKRDEPEKSITLIDLFFELHGGKAWGLPGKLLYDASGILIIFLSVSAFYMWYFPKKKRTNRTKKSKKMFKVFTKYHLKLSIWFAVIFLLIGGTGLFMRPPMLAILVGGEIPAKYYPGLKHASPWHKKIRNAMYDSQKDMIYVDATDGFWSAPANLSESFVESQPPAPIFPMGATVFRRNEDGNLLIGSFLGLFSVENGTGEIKDAMTGNRAGKIKSIRPGENMVTGYFKTPGGEEYLNTHYKGLISLGDRNDDKRFAMPAEMSQDFRMPLWNYLFEIHNGRFFQGILGDFYILLVPLGALLFVTLVLTGIYDWVYLKVIRKRKMRRNKKQISKKEFEPAHKTEAEKHEVEV